MVLWGYNTPVATQARSVATRSALLDAALACLVERGYAGTTTTEVAHRAGVSRGAQLHHFPSKADLLAAAVEYLFERRLIEFREAFAQVDTGAYRLDAAVDLLWQMFQGPAFVAWAELWMAARTDPDLAATVGAVDRRFGEQSQQIFAELFPPEPGVDTQFYVIGRDFAFALMTGVAFGCMLPCADRPPSDYLDALKFINRMFVPVRLPEEES